MVGFAFNKQGRLDATFTEGEMSGLVQASGNPNAFSATINGIIDSSTPSSDCCYPTVYRRQPHEALHAVRLSEQIASLELSPAEVHQLGATIGLAMFGTRATSQPTFEGASI